MSQSKRASLVESITNTLAGYGVAILSQLIIFPTFNIHIPLASNFWIAGWFSVISIVRSYILRRIFNTLTKRADFKKLYGVRSWQSDL